MDKYKCFKELQVSERLGIDYDIVSTPRKGTSVVVLAPHGGDIEPRTAELAEAIAGSEFSLYCFIGKKENDNRDLHIASHNFDEPKGLALVGAHKWVIAIHGCDKKGQRVLLGGRNQLLMAKLVEVLSAVGIDVETSGHGYTGTDPLNICNRGATKAGAQLELSMSFRRGPQVEKFVAAMRDVLSECQDSA
jgi:phage replication-related protein YjqB (UPF0714/DUF867 family)